MVKSLLATHRSVASCVLLGFSLVATQFACKTVPGARVQSLSEPADDKQASPLSQDQRQQYARYLSDTIASLEAMRGKTGLIKDSIWVCWDRDRQQANFRDTEQLTSPTNIGLDIILLTQTITHSDQGEQAKARVTLQKLLETLGRIDYHKANGLFFRTYWPDSGEAADINLSSVDNLHLAFGLWVAATALPPADLAMANKARSLFARMDFSDFYNESTGLIGGNMRPVAENPARKIKGDPQGAYVRDAFDYRYFGSEARSLYALAWALGLYKKASARFPDFDAKIIDHAIAGTTAELAAFTTASGKSLRLLRTWDGGGFQALLPAVLVREDVYSPALAELHHNYAERLLSDAHSLGVPAAHSASAFGVKGLRMFRTGNKTYDKGLPIYNGKSGHVDMVATEHHDVEEANFRPYWDAVYTPHPAFMAASFARDAATTKAFADVFRSNESLQSASSCVCRQTPATSSASSCECRAAADLTNDREHPGEEKLCSVAAKPSEVVASDHLYTPGWGWLDGYYVRGPLKGRVVPVLISLDQAMIAISLHSLLSADGHHVGSKALAKDQVVLAKLKRAYAAIDKKLAALKGGSY